MKNLLKKIKENEMCTIYQLENDHRFLLQIARLEFPYNVEYFWIRPTKVQELLDKFDDFDFYEFIDRSKLSYLKALEKYTKITISQDLTEKFIENPIELEG